MTMNKEMKTEIDGNVNRQMIQKSVLVYGKQKRTTNIQHPLSLS
jgi:hypothetical protein